MNVTDSQRGAAAGTLILTGLVANVGLTILSYLINWLVPGSYEGIVPVVEELFWLGAVGVLVTGLFQLAGAVSDGTMLRLAGGVMIFNALVDLTFTVFMKHMGGGLFWALVNDGSLLLSLVSRGLLILVMVQLTMKTHAWVLPLLGMVALLSVMRSAISAALQHQLIDYELYRQPVVSVSLPLVSIFNACAMAAAGFAVKAVASTGPTNGVLGTQELVAAAGLRPAPPEPISPASDFLVGGILLMVGIGVTAVSLAAASNGGRYIVATGAIGVGIGRIIRGFVRMARGA